MPQPCLFYFHLSPKEFIGKKDRRGCPFPGLDGAHTPPHPYIKFQNKMNFKWIFFGTNHSLIQNAWHMTFTSTRFYLIYYFMHFHHRNIILKLVDLFEFKITEYAANCTNATPVSNISYIIKHNSTTDTFYWKEYFLYVLAVISRIFSNCVL